MVQYEDILLMLLEGLYMSHDDFVAISDGDVTNASNQYMMCDGLVNKLF